MKEFKSFYKSVGGNEGGKCHYNTRLDVYGCGCEHNCEYCYARSLLAFRGLWRPDDPSVADIHKIKRKLLSIPHETILRMGGMTDCFQPCEKNYKVAKQTIEAMNEYGIEYLIVTKSALIASDEYVEIMDKNLAHIQISITSTDDETAKRYENASPISERIKAIEKLQKAGFDVSIRLSPYLPQLVDLSVINDIKCDKILVEFLRVNPFIERTFHEIDLSEYTVKQSNYRHLSLEKKLKYLSDITIPQKSVCDDVDEHYDYFKNHFNYNSDDCCNLRRR